MIRLVHLTGQLGLWATFPCVISTVTTTVDETNETDTSLIVRNMLYQVLSLSLGLVLNPAPMAVEIRQVQAPAFAQAAAISSPIFPSVVVADLLDDFAEKQSAEDAALAARVREPSSQSMSYCTRPNDFACSPAESRLRKEGG